MKRTKRRDLLILAAVVGGVYGLRSLPWSEWTRPPLSYSDLPGVAPFRVLNVGGEVSSLSSPLVGLNETPAQDITSVDSVVRADPCSSLYGGARTDETLPIAYFSEIRCPSCRSLEKSLDAVFGDTGEKLSLRAHELPIFGPPSELAARALIAADYQGKAQALRIRLTRAPIVLDQGSLIALAENVGLDPEQLMQDMAKPSVQAALDTSRALADLFGFVGTPGLVIGRTVIRGAVPESVLREVINDELSSKWNGCAGSSN